MRISHEIAKRLTKVPVGAFAVFLFSSMLQGCFTGIESTPKITYKESGKEKSELTPERKFADSFRGTPFSQWQAGRRFLVADNKAALSYLAIPGKDTRIHRGDTLIYLGLREVPAITGGYAAELVFKNSAGGDSITYRPGGDAASLKSRRNLPLPFVVDLELVAYVSRQLTGKELFTRTDRWISSGGNEIRGRKFLKIKVSSVTAANENYPFLVSFSSMEKSGEDGNLLMSVTVDEDIPALRGFENLFLLSDPRPAYDAITDDTWELIRQGKVREGMTTREASLSLGFPRDIDRRHDQSLQYERWSYPDGIYLIFEDGLLVRFNI